MTKKAKAPAVEPATVAEKPAVENQAPAVEPATVAETVKIEVVKPFYDKNEDVAREVGEVFEPETARGEFIISQGFAKKIA